MSYWEFFRKKYLPISIFITGLGLLSFYLSYGEDIIWPSFVFFSIGAIIIPFFAWLSWRGKRWY